jgi:hypothetical protein
MLLFIGAANEAPWLAISNLFSVSETVPADAKLISPDDFNAGRIPDSPIAIRTLDVCFAPTQNKIFLGDVLKRIVISDRSDGLIPTVVSNETNMTLGKCAKVRCYYFANLLIRARVLIY